MKHKYPIDSINRAQTDMNRAYRAGATGVLVSGFVWLTTALTIDRFSVKQAIWVLLVGGALIHPVSLLINWLTGIKAAPDKDNPLLALALEGTFFMLMTIPVAYGLSLLRPEWFFQGMLLTIGGRYLTFQTLYGNRLFWLLGGLLGLSTYGLFTIHAQALLTTLTGGFIEVVFGLTLLATFSSKKKAGSEELAS